MAPRHNSTTQGISKRSVRNMDPVRAAKKRKADREAQNRNRIRQKTLVESLQEENRNLRMEGSYQVQALSLQVEKLRSRVLDLQAENLKLASNSNAVPQKPPPDIYDSSVDTDYTSSRSTPLRPLSAPMTSPTPKNVHMTQSCSQDHLMPPLPTMNSSYTHSPSPLLSENTWQVCPTEEFGPTAPLDFSDSPYKTIECDYLGFGNFEQSQAYNTHFMPDMTSFEQPYYVQAAQTQHQYI